MASQRSDTAESQSKICYHEKQLMKEKAEKRQASKMEALEWMSGELHSYMQAKSTRAASFKKYKLLNNAANSKVV